MRAKRVALIAAILGLVLLAGLAWFSSFFWFPGITPAQTARILIDDHKFGGRALKMSFFWGDLILEPLRDASGDFARLHIHNSFHVAKVLARNGSQRSLALASELYQRDESIASLVGAVGLSAHGRLQESEFQPGGKLHAVLVDEQYRCLYKADGKRDYDREPLTANALELALMAAGYARSRSSVPAILAWFDGCSSDPTVQAYAADALAAIGDRRAVPVLRSYLGSPDSHAVPPTFCALVALRDRQAIPLAIERIPPETRFVRSVVPELEAVTGQDFGFDKRRWREWWKRNETFELRRSCPDRT